MQPYSSCHRSHRLQLLTVEDAIQSQDNSRGICGAQSDTGTDFFFLQVLSFSPATLYSINDEYSSITACKVYDKSNQPAWLILQSPFSADDFLLTQNLAVFLLVFFVFLFVQHSGKLLYNNTTDLSCYNS
jgi:hypothetical protein